MMLVFLEKLFPTPGLTGSSSQHDLDTELQPQSNTTAVPDKTTYKYMS